MEFLTQQPEEKPSSPEYIVLDEDDNEIKFKRDSIQQQPVIKKQKLNIEYLKSLPTLLPITEIDIEVPVATDININDFINEWREQDLDELLLIDDYVYKDPLIKNMTPHESYVYTIGLNLALENVTNSYKNSIKFFEHCSKQNKMPTTNGGKESEEKKAIFNLKLGVDNEKEFLENLEENSLKIKKMNKTLIKSHQLKYGCKICSFRSDNFHIIDQHLTHPHNLHSKGLVTYRDTFTTLKCNFCDDFKTFTKDEYVKHIQTVHRRLYITNKPTYAYNCNYCDYECREKLRFQKHEQNCSYNNEEFKKNNLRPSLDDDFNYEFLFPNSVYINKKRLIPNPLAETQLMKLAQNNSLGTTFKIKQLTPNGNHGGGLLNNDKIVNILNKNKSNQSTVNFKQKSSLVPISTNNNVVSRQKQACFINNLLNKQSNQNESCFTLFPKFLICPVCNCSISNLVDLTNHLRIKHNLTEKTANAIINEKVIPQLSKSSSSSSVLKDNSNSSSSSVIHHNSSLAPSIINLTNFNKKSTQSPLVNVHKHFVSKSINSDLGITTTTGIVHKGPKIKVIDYVSELKIINCYLKLNKHAEGKLNEVKTIAGKCFLCENKTVFDLLQHLKQQHCLLINSKCFETSCLLCGNSVENREDLVAHQFEVHKIITFVSLNKVFTLSKYENHDVEKKKTEEKLTALINKNIEKNPPKIESLTVIDSVRVKNKQNLQKVITDSKSNINRQHTISAITAAFEAEPTPKSNNTEGGSIMKTYSCNECTMKFEDFYAYCSHLIKEHQKSPKSSVKCPICKNLFHRGPPYQTHIKTHLKICQIEVKRLNINKSKTYKMNEFELNEKKSSIKKIINDDVIVIDE